MICESCKNNIPETAKFCPRCGNKIEKDALPPAEEKQETGVSAAPVAAASVAGATAASSEPSASAAGADTSAASAPASGGPGAAVSPGPVKDETIVVAEKPKSGSPALLIVILLVLFIAAAAGGYYYYNKYIKKDPQQTQTPAGAPGQAQVPGTPAGQTQPGSATDPSMSQPQSPSSQAGGPAVPSTQPQQPDAQPGSPAGASSQPSQMQPMTPPQPQDQYQPPPQMRTRIAIRASALAADFRNGRPVGFSSSFRFGASRVVHYVQYDKASVGQTTLSSQFYQNGAMLFKCGPSPLQYKSGKYFCRAAQNLNPGNYEVKLIVDGNEEQILRFTVSY